MDSTRILIVRLGAIGDVVHTLPALAALRRALPGAYLAWIVECGGAARLLEGNPCLDELIEVDMRGWRHRLTRGRTLREIRNAIERMRDSSFDLALDFQGLLKSAMIPWLVRVPRRVGFARDALREPAGAFMLTEQVEANDQDHVIKKNLQLVAHLSCDVKGKYEFPIALSSQDELFANEQAALYDGSFAIINPGGGWTTKLWGAGNYANIADRLWENHRIHSVVTYGPGEESLARDIIKLTRSGGATILDTGLKQFFALAQNAKIFIGGDTGPMHLAAAAGTPIVAIFGPTDSRRNGPFADNDVVIERFDLDCRTDCYRRSCSHTSCMNIPVETVWQGVEKRLQSASRSV
jgi:heptosyltransferase I